MSTAFFNLPRVKPDRQAPSSEEKHSQKTAFWVTFILTIDDLSIKSGELMGLSLDDNRATYQIKGYKPGLIQVNDETYNKSLIIAPYQLITDWPPQTLLELTPQHLQQILTLSPAILLLGTGEHLDFPSMELYGDLINEGIGVEVMDTSAACRTYNALTAEERNVVAALIIR